MTRKAKLVYSTDRPGKVSLGSHMDPVAVALLSHASVVKLPPVTRGLPEYKGDPRGGKPGKRRLNSQPMSLVRGVPAVVWGRPAKT